MEDAKGPSPVALFVYNRPEHTEKTLRALSANKLAERSELYIFSDGPKRGMEDEVASVRALISGALVEPFAKVQVIEAETNKGLANSIIDGVNHLFETFETAIILEDDLITSESFLLFMNEALNKYKENQGVFSLAGYCYPDQRFKIPRDFKDHVFLLPRIGSWGWATWKDRWQKAIWDPEYYLHLSQQSDPLDKYDKTGEDKSKLIKLLAGTEIDSWAIRWDYSMFLQGSRTVYPVKSLVQNIGFDNSGRHGKSYEEKLVRVELSDEMPTLPDIPKEDERLTREYLKLYKRPSILKRLKYKLLGLLRD